MTFLSAEGIVYDNMARTFTPTAGMNLKRIRPATLRAWVDPKSDGIRSDGFELRFKGDELKFARQIVIFLASDPDRVKKAKLGEPIEYFPPTKEARG